MYIFDTLIDHVTWSGAALPGLAEKRTAREAKSEHSLGDLLVVMAAGRCTLGLHVSKVKAGGDAA